MANQEHFNILKKGVEIWNQWREEYTEIEPDLSGIELSITNINTQLNDGDLKLSTIKDLFNGPNLENANLSGTRLDRANLENANLSGAQLDNSSLIQTNFSGANLSNTSLQKADLKYARLNRTNLSGANFEDAYLNGVNLSDAELRETNLNRAYLYHTVFARVDLSSAKGLETVAHGGPSTVELYSVILPRNVDMRFLRGVGIPDSYIEYANSLINQPINYYTCFISYTKKDEDFVKRFHADLQSEGVRCWFAPEDLKIGDHYHQRIDESILLYEKLILILSEHAIQSAWVEREMVAAREKEDQMQRSMLFPLRLDDAVMSTTKAWAADVRRRWYISDFTHWKEHDAYQQAFQHLLRDLKTEQKSKE